MRFGAIVCPRCKKARGIILTSKTTTCPHCSKKYRTKDLRVHYKTDSAKELAAAVGELNALLHNKLKEYKKMSIKTAKNEKIKK